VRRAWAFDRESSMIGSTCSSQKKELMGGIGKVEPNHSFPASVSRGIGLRRTSIRPRMIANFAVTYRCDSRCVACNIWKASESRRQEMDLDEIKSVFVSNRSFLLDVTSIQLTGGEPFLRPDLPAIVSVISENLPNCIFWIPTNGMSPLTVEKTTKEILSILGGKGLGISVSIDGIGRIHDKMRGVDGSYTKAVETVRRLVSLKNNASGLKLSIGMTLTTENYIELWDVYVLARGLGVEFSFRPVNFSDIYYKNVGSDLALKDAFNELIPTVEEIWRDIVKRRGILRTAPTVYYMRGVIRYIRAPAARRLPCSAGSDSFFLDPEGNVYPCIILNLRMGNVRKEPLEHIWNSAEAQRARRMIRESLCPGCWVECETFRDIRRDKIGLIFTAVRALFE